MISRQRILAGEAISPTTITVLSEADYYLVGMRYTCKSNEDSDNGCAGHAATKAKVSF
jgi:hypothetical protein